jgi:hypothetical protein
MLATSNGNRLAIVDAWRHRNPKHSAGKFINLFRSNGLQSHQISGDAGGLGVGFLYDLQECGFHVREIHNGCRHSFRNYCL